ncbi:bidirectional sugar transporter SWEET14-like [Solanum pennellii]|uniref:Bidirectional sugar transporter SWEET n=1 Tax=Solanum pennellii TaxID=28526 RepID=A0ABM1GCU2_SOLPN|nr:bidirectional sugar transporter SWEET14-like [Solanum pennellii]
MTTHLAFVFGLLGNIVSFMVYLAPVPTFYKIYKKKSTEGFQSVPYVVGLFSAMLWIYYAFLKPDTTLLITINSVGCFIQTFYICFFLFYATKKAKMDTMKLLLSMNVVGLGLIIFLTQFFAKGSNRAQIVGWICLIFSFCVFVAPLGVLRQVIRTKSVEYMPFQLSFFLTLSAVMWFLYGLLRKDYNIAIPNVLGFSLGVIQMTLYLIYNNAKKVTKEVKLEVTEIVADDKELKLSEEILKDQIIDVVKLSAIVCSEIIPMVTGNELKNEINLPQLNVIINEDMIIKPKAIIEAS